jgi:hypothetical protein
VNILFIDDTESKEYVGIGGVVFHDDCLNNLFSEFNQKKASHNIPPKRKSNGLPQRTAG